MEMVRFYVLNRLSDPVGQSGTGPIASVIEVPDGRCVVLWNTQVKSLGVYQSRAEVEFIHCHQGSSRLEKVLELPFTAMGGMLTSTLETVVESERSRLLKAAHVEGFRLNAERMHWLESAAERNVRETINAKMDAISAAERSNNDALIAKANADFVRAEREHQDFFDQRMMSPVEEGIRSWLLDKSPSLESVGLDD